MQSGRQHSGARIVVATLALIAMVAVGVIQYRGPTPHPVETPPDLPSAGRMRKTLSELLGSPAEKHTTGTESGEAFLARLESKIQSFGVTTERIEIAYDKNRQKHHPRSNARLLPSGAVLKNLMVTVPGRNPALAPILVATHHDSCRWGPGAGDAGSAVVALVEHIRILSLDQPFRTTHYLFTDGEEYGLVGAYAIAAQDPLPFRKPVFVLNFDARGTTGGVPMFETHRGNAAWVQATIGELARPQITSSLAVTVYRSLPNATDFTVFESELDFQGFNYATIGGAHRYHRPDDVPENVSDRTLQHMGDHLFCMHRAIDAMDSAEISELTETDPSEGDSNAVFFDVVGVTVLSFSERLQKLLAMIAMSVLVGCCWTQTLGRHWRRILREAAVVAISVAIGFGVGWCAKLILWTTPWRQLRYTPVDYPAGVITVVVAFVVTTMVLERIASRAGERDTSYLADVTWLVTAMIGLALAFLLPGGAYLLVLPSLAYATVRIIEVRVSLRSGMRPRLLSLAPWFGWAGMVVLVGPLLALLVQALGPWQQPLYALIAGLLAVLAKTTWLAPPRRKEAETEGVGTPVNATV